MCVCVCVCVCACLLLLCLYLLTRGNKKQQAPPPMNEPLNPQPTQEYEEVKAARGYDPEAPPPPRVPCGGGAPPTPHALHQDV